MLLIVNNNFATTNPGVHVSNKQTNISELIKIRNEQADSYNHISLSEYDSKQLKLHIVKYWILKYHPIVTSWDNTEMTTVHT